jgi:hypothetical protein
MGYGNVGCAAVLLESAGAALSRCRDLEVPRRHADARYRVVGFRFAALPRWIGDRDRDSQPPGPGERCVLLGYFVVDGQSVSYRAITALAASSVPNFVISAFAWS